ncbi:MAG: hypothetical protein K8T20_19440 [Planctomycetes bacterium]|nr:hypothetical protein [Planctomycetota bacterium]
MIDSIPASKRPQFEPRAYRHRLGFVIEFEMIPEEFVGTIRAQTLELRSSWRRGSHSGVRRSSASDPSRTSP